MRRMYIRVSYDATEEEIREALTRIFRQHTRDYGKVLKMSTMTDTQISDQLQSKTSPRTMPNTQK